MPGVLFFLAMAKMTKETQLGLALFNMNPTLAYEFIVLTVKWN